MGRIVAELTNRCNLSCHHCFSGRHGGRDDLPLEAFDKVLQEARLCGFDLISFTGGDPTLHQQFFEIVKRTFEGGYQFGFVTNGWNFTDIFPRLAPYRERLGGITFSLDGATESTHDGLRGKGSFRRVMKALSVCVFERVPFTLNMVVTKGNRHELEPMVELATRLGSRALRIAHLMPSTLSHELGLDMPPAERKAVEAEIRSLQGKSAIPVVLSPGYHTETLFPCAPLQDQELNIDCRGNVTLCCQLSSHGSGAGQQDVLGNLQEISFGDAVRRLHQLREVFRQRKQTYAANGTLRDSDLFACWYCSLYFEKHNWLHTTPEHAWSAMMWKPNPDRQESPARSSDLISIAQSVRKGA